MSTYGPIITSADIEDAVRATLRRWLDTMLGEVERQSGDRWDLRQIERPKSWQLVTDYTKATADRRLPCVAVESVAEAFSYDGDGTVHAEVGMNVVVIAKGQDRDKTRETLAGLVAGVLQVLWKHGDLDGSASAVAIGEITRDAVSAEKAKTAAGARIPIAVLVDAVASKRGGPSEPDAPEDPLPPDSPEYPDHLTTTITVNGSLSTSEVPVTFHPSAPGVGAFLPSVATLADLPTTGNNDGDVRLVRDEDISYVWDAESETWSPLAGGDGTADIVTDSGDPEPDPGDYPDGTVWRELL